MLEDGRIRSSLIWDESCLSNTRTCVAWLSPNHWPNGSLYGNVEFRFEWRKLVQGKKLFWVEAIEKYNPPAFRILITDKDTFQSLEPYPAEESGGPLFYDSESDAWYWNGQFTGEFMVDEDLSVEHCTGIRFCNHHTSICRKDGALCSDLGQMRDDAGVKLLGLAIGTKVVNSTSRNRLLFMEGGELEWSAEHCIKRILKDQHNCPFSGHVAAGDDAALPLATAILQRIGRHRDPCRLASLFKTAKDLEISLRKRMAKAFAISLEDFPASDHKD
jgi:hypothetical protein